MWPYRPWLFKAQQPPPQVQQTPEGNQSTGEGPSNVQIRPLPQTQVFAPRPIRNWTRRYHPSINARVYGYPSTGGVLILPGYDLDLPYLGLVRLVDASRSSNPAEEDAFCRRLRYLGAIWWPYPDADLDALKGHGSQEDAHRAATHVCVGWLPNAGGIWVLKYNENDSGDNDLSLKAQRIGSMIMGDRCRMIEELGGKYYRHPEECEDLRWGNWPTMT